MIRLLEADFIRLFKNKTAYITFGIFILLTATLNFYIIKSGGNFTLSTNILRTYSLAVMIPFFTLIPVCSFIGEDFESGTMRNKVSGGVRRTDIFFSKYIVCIWFVTAFFLVVFAAAVITAVIFKLRFLALLFFGLCAYVAVCAVCALTVTISFICGRKTTSLIASFAVCAALLLSASAYTLFIAEPVYNGDVIHESVYVDGKLIEYGDYSDPEMSIEDIAIRVNPISFFGELIFYSHNFGDDHETFTKEVFSLTNYAYRSATYPCFSGAFWIASMLIGYSIFRKKELL